MEEKNKIGICEGESTGIIISFYLTLEKGVLMKSLEKYMALPYRMEIVEDKDEGGFAVSFPDMPGCVTCGETLETAMQNAEDAKRAWISAALEEGIEITENIKLKKYC